MTENPHISHSAITTWNKCPHLYKLRYVDQIKYNKTNLYSIFGNSIHETMAEILPTVKDYVIQQTLEEIQSKFKDRFLRKIHNDLEEHKKKEILKEKHLKDAYKDMSKCGGRLIISAINHLNKSFPGWKIVYLETEFHEPIIEYSAKDYDFKGIMDLIIQLSDGTFKVIDWKTCSWGWDIEKKSDTLVQYQLTYYKHFFCLKNNIDLSKTTCFFALIKRTAKDEENNIEFLEVKVGERKIKNSLELIKKMLHNVDKRSFPKNRLSCSSCDLYKTEFCKG